MGQSAITERDPGDAVASKYSDEFKAAVVRQVSVEGLPLKQVADATGVSPATLRRWLKTETPPAESAAGAAPVPVSVMQRLILLDEAETHVKLERILRNEGYQPEVGALCTHALGRDLPAVDWLAGASLFAVTEAGARRLVDLIERSGKDISIAWLDQAPDWTMRIAPALDCEWLIEATPERLSHGLERLHERRRTRARVRECQRHFEHLQRCCLRAFDSSPVPIAIVRPEGHIYANPAYLRSIGGADFAALRDRPPGALLASDEVKVLNAALMDIQDHEQIELDVTLASGQCVRAELERFPGVSQGVQLTLRLRGQQAPVGESQPETAAETRADVEEISPEWTERIAEALKSDDRFSVLYQPIVSLSGGTEASYEALLRLHDERGGEYLPGVFLPAARRAGLMGIVDQWVIRRAAAQVKSEWSTGRAVRIFVNLAHESLLGDGFQDWLARLIEYFQIPAESLVFEIPEDVPLQHLQACRAVVDALRGLGCGIILDDFDGGEEAFALLDALPVDGVKIDLSRIRMLTDAAVLQQRVRDIAARVHGAGGQVIAGRVQDAQSVALLWQCGVDYVQGYFMQQPSRALDYDFISSECEVTERRGSNPFTIG